MRRSLSIAQACVGLIVVASCAPDAPAEYGWDFEIETKWMTLRGYDHAEEDICGGTIQWMDSYVDALSEPLELPATKIGVYRWYSEDLWDALGICGDVAGCAFGYNGYFVASAPVIPFEHEIAHVAMDSGFDPCIAILSEGLSEYLRGTDPSDQGAVDDATIEDVLAVGFDGIVMRSSDYRRSRHFVSFLAFEFGLNDVVALCAAAPKGITRSEFNDAVVSILGMSLDEVLIAYDDYPLCSEEKDRAKLLECSREPVLQVGLDEEQFLEIDASCDHPEAVGPRHGMYHFSYQIRVLEDGDYSWGFMSKPLSVDISGARLRLEQCASCGDGAVGFSHAWDPNYIPLPEFLPAGDYALEIQLPLELSGEVSVRILGGAG